MKYITKAAINRPVTIIVTLVAMILFALVSITDMSLQLMPDINIPMLVLVDTYPGASPEEVDRNVMEKLREACANTSGLKKTQTSSSESYGTLVLQFDYGTDIAKAHDDIRSKLELVKSELPEDATDPTIIELDVNSLDDMTLSVSTESMDTDLLNLVNEILKPRLQRSSALADISITGGDEKYIAVRIIPEYANQYGISASGIVSAITAVNYSIPAGSVSYGNQTLNMETEVRYEDIERLKKVPIATSKGQTIHLEDICDIGYGISDRTGLSRYNGNDDISIGLKRKQSSTSVTLSRQVKSILEEFSKEYPTVNIKIVNDSADEILDTLKSVIKTMGQGILLAMFVIFVFFGDLKGSLIVGSTMPVSLLAAVVCMYFAGISLNVISMNALVLSIGMITDNAVVVIELCFRKQEDGLDFVNAAYEGTAVVINSVIGSTLTTVIVYLPLALLEGLSGQYFKQLGYTIVFVLTASLISAITLVPFFFSIYKPTERKNNPVTALINRIGRVYGNFLEKIMKRSLLVILFAFLLFALSIYLATGLKSELLAATDEGLIQIDVKFRPNLSLETMDRAVTELEDFVKNSGLADDYSIRITESTSSATVTAYKADSVELSSQSIADSWNEALRDFSTSCEITVTSGSTTGISSMNSGASEEKDIASDDLDSLIQASEELSAVLEATPGVITVNSSAQNTGSKIMIDVDPEMARAKGFSASQLSQLIYMNMTGADAGEVTIDHNNYSIKVEYPKDYFTSLDEVRAMTFTSPTGNTVSLSEIADIRFRQAPQTITRTDGRYSASVTAVMTIDSKDAVLEDINSRIADIELPTGVSFVENSITSTMNEEFADIGKAIIIGLYLVFMVMAIQFESVAYAILIMLCIPFASIGSILLLRILDVKVSMTVLMGVLMLAGIVVNNGIIFIDTTNQKRAAGEEIKSALVNAGKDRLRPILITSLTTVLSMLPVALKLAKNSETLQGMGVVIVGGLIASTLLTLLLLPNFYLIFDKFKGKKKRKKVGEKKAAETKELEITEDEANEPETKELEIKELETNKPETEEPETNEPETIESENPDTPAAAEGGPDTGESGDISDKAADGPDTGETGDNPGKVQDSSDPVS